MITSEMVKDLREKTGAGMMDCKKALEASAGNLEEAIRFLREKGLAAAQKKQGRIAAEGTVAIAVAPHGASLIELNCETDFVARNADFQAFAQSIAEQALRLGSSLGLSKENEGHALLSQPLLDNLTLEQALAEKTASIGEKISLRRVRFVGDGFVFGSYAHGGGSIGALVYAKVSPETSQNEAAKVLREVAMHVAASNPLFLDRSQVSEDVLSKERQIVEAQVKEQGKPEAVAKRIIEGKLDKWHTEVCLMEQPFIKDPDSSLQKWIAKEAQRLSCEIHLQGFVRFKVGEGIEKKADDFAAEVAKMTAN